MKSKIYRIELGQKGKGFCRKQSDNHLEGLSRLMIKGFRNSFPLAPPEIIRRNNTFFWFTEKGFECFGKLIIHIALNNGAIFQKDVVLKTKEINNEYNVIYEDDLQVALETNN